MIRASGKHAARAATKLIERTDRKPLLRRSELRAKPVDPVTGEKRWSSFKRPDAAPLVSTTRLKRSRLVSRVKVRATAEGGDEAYLDFVRGLPCCVYGTAAPSHPHHETGNGRGKGQKAHDHRTMPMSFRAHREFHDGKGYFEYWTADARRIWQDVEVQRVQELYAAYQSGTRFTEVA